MQTTVSTTSARSSPIASGPARFERLDAHESSTAELLFGCPVITAEGDKIGTVDHLMVDVETHQLRYVVLAGKPSAATVTLPWHALYFDGACASLVFYTLC